MLPPKVGQPLKLALDQNFPTDLLSAVSEWLPTEVHIDHIAQIDRRLSDLDDDRLVIALRQIGYDGLVTNNYKMLEVPHEIAAIVATKSVVIATVKMGHDPIRAAGALLLELPGLPDRLLPNVANVFWLSYERRKPGPAWDFLIKTANKLGIPPSDLWDEHKPSDLVTPILESG